MEKKKRSKKEGEAKILLRIDESLKQMAENIAVTQTRSLNGYIINLIRQDLIKPTT